MDGIAHCANVVLVRILLIAPIELCEVCKGREESPDGNRSLHLVASAGTSRDQQIDHSRLDGDFHHFSIGERKIGHVAQSGEPLLLAGLRGDEEWIADRAWAEREG